MWAWPGNKCCKLVLDPYVKIRRIGSYFITGMFPPPVKTMLEKYCPQSKVEYGKFLHSMQRTGRLIRGVLQNSPTEIVSFFPAYVHQGEDSNVHKTFWGYPFVSLVTAPRVAVLVHHHLFDEIRVNVFLWTIFQSWPLWVFILFSDCLAGLINVDTGP